MYVVTVQHCSSCGKKHNALPTTTLKEPHVINGITYYVMATCPVTGKPIYPVRESTIRVG